MEPLSPAQIDRAIQDAVNWKPKWHVRLRLWFAGRRRTHHLNAQRLARYVGLRRGLEVGKPRFGEPKGRSWVGFSAHWKFETADLIIPLQTIGDATHVRAVISPALSDRAITLEFYKTEETPRADA